ncbi:hypothetical protein ACFY8C_18335 [Streptomyces flavochromogenes]|uniref:Serine kinase n=1 Tax=Streptomyces flavochromogenes TaxID=68199 RepID=A0ABW6XS13_9ACTN|nr:hypothetical protein [Streptomyces flavochromogenes]
MTSDLSAPGPAAPGRAAPGPSTASQAASGRLVSERVVAEWEFAVPPGAAGSFWDGVDPVEGLDVFTGALARGAGPLPSSGAVRLGVRAVDAYRPPSGEPPPAPGGPWAAYSESGPVRRIHWPAREASGTAGLLTASPDPAHAHGAVGGTPRADDAPLPCGAPGALVEVSASHEAFRRKLTRMALIAPLMLSGGMALIHGVAVTRDDGFTVLLAGASGSGKSTLGLAAFAHGWRVVAEDLVFVTGDLAVVPLFLSGAWECRAHPDDRALIERVTGTPVEGHSSGLPADHRGREYLFPVRPGAGPAPARPLPVDLVVFVDRGGDAPVSSGGRAGQVLGAGPRSTLGAVAKLLRLDFAPVVRETEETLRRVVEELPSRRFAATGRIEDDVPAFLAALDRWAS